MSLSLRLYPSFSDVSLPLSPTLSISVSISFLSYSLFVSLSISPFPSLYFCFHSLSLSLSLPFYLSFAVSGTMFCLSSPLLSSPSLPTSTSVLYVSALQAHHIRAHTEPLESDAVRKENRDEMTLCCMTPATKGAFDLFVVFFKT